MLQSSLPRQLCYIYINVTDSVVKTICMYRRMRVSPPNIIRPRNMRSDCGYLCIIQLVSPPPPLHTVQRLFYTNVTYYYYYIKKKFKLQSS